MDVHIRWMIRRDMADVLNIENACFEFPWSEADFTNALRQRNCIGMVAEHNARIMGFMIYELHKQHLHILNFAVAPFQGRGIGRQMLEKLREKLSRERRNRIQCEVRERNLDALMFFKAMGFRATGLLRDFYRDSPEDAIRMEYRHPCDVFDSLVFGDGKVVRVAE